MNATLEVGELRADRGKKVSGNLFVADKPANSLEIPLTVINGERDGPLVSITAGTHGTEYTGMAAALDLISTIDPGIVSGGLLLVPVVNVPGFEQRSRCVFPFEDDYNGTRNLNRLFPGNESSSLPYLMVRTLFEKVISKADFVIDLHGGDIYESFLHPFVMTYIGGGDEVDERVAGIARASGFSLCFKAKVEARIGGLVAESIRRGVPAVTLESGSGGIIDEQRVEAVYNAVINILRHVKVLSGEEKNYGPTKLVKGSSIVRANRGGLLRTKVKLGSSVKPGEELGEIRSLDGKVSEHLLSPVSGQLSRWTCNPSVSSGENVASIWQISDD